MYLNVTKYQPFTVPCIAACRLEESERDSTWSQSGVLYASIWKWVADRKRKHLVVHLTSLLLYCRIGSLGAVSAVNSLTVTEKVMDMCKSQA